MAVTILGLTIGDTGTGYVVPTYAQIREAIATKLRQLRNKANLQTQPGSLFGDFIDMVTAGSDLGMQGNLDVVARTLFTGAEGVALDQLLAGYITRVQASASTAMVYAYGSAGAAFGAGTLVRTAQTAPAFATDGAVVIPVAPASAYAVEIADFVAGAYAGQNFTVTVAGTPVVYTANGGDTGQSVRNGLVTLINAEPLLTQVAYLGGQSPTNGTWALVVTDGGLGPFSLSVSAPLGTTTAYNAIASPATCQITGPTPAPAESLRVFAPLVGIQGAVNVDDAIAGRTRETDSQLRARFQVLQRGLGGGSPDAVLAIILADPVVGGGGATQCAVEYNPSDVTDGVGNLPHSLRVVVDTAADGLTVAQALWRAKAAGDNTNGPESYNVVDSVGNTQGPIRIDRFADVWIGAEIEVTKGEGWPGGGDPGAQLAQDVSDYIEALQPGKDVAVNALPISFFPNGLPRGVANFTVRVGIGPGPGGPFIFNDYYPNVEPDAALASVSLNARQKARNVVTDVAVTVV